MKALVFTDYGVVDVMDVPDVTTVEGEVVVNVVRTGICGSELHGIASPIFGAASLTNDPGNLLIGQGWSGSSR